MVSQTPDANRLQDVGRAKVRGSPWPARSPAPGPDCGQRGQTSGYLTKPLLSPLHCGIEVGSGEEPEVAERPGCCVETQTQPPSAPARLTSLPHLTSSAHFLLSHSFSHPLRAPPKSGGGYPFLSQALPACPSGPGLLPPPWWAGWIQVCVVGWV